MDDLLFSDDIEYLPLVSSDEWHLKMWDALMSDDKDSKSVFVGQATTAELNPSTPFIATTPS
jgi:hypothetical protein